jgi:photosystem II stability/assembly factor-like uncharacterized protein
MKTRFMEMVFCKKHLSRKIAAMLLCCLALPAITRPQTWQRLGPEGGLVVSMAACADGSVYLGTPDGHVFARPAAVPSQSAKKWEMRGRVAGRTDAVVARLLCDPVQANILYAAVWFQETAADGGVFRSEDQGRTWALLGLAGEAVRALEQALSNPQILVAGTRTGVFRSQDAGKNWQRISAAGDQELRNLDSIAIDPSDPELLYVGTYHLPWKTHDGGKTWKPIATGLIDDSDIMSLRIDTTNPQRIYLSACSGIYRSENQGELWFKLPGIPYTARRTQAIVQDPAHPQTLYAATTEGLWVTRDGGENWKRSTPADWVINAVITEANGLDTGSVLLGTEAQGVMSGGDGAESWAPDNASFTHTVVRELVSDPRDSSHLLMVLQRSGSELLESRDAGMSWTPAALTIKPLRGKPSVLNAGAIQRIYASPAGWFLKLAPQQLWFWPRADSKESPATWNQIPLRLPAPAQKKLLRHPPASQRATGQVTWNGNLAAFTGENFFLAAQEGILRCSLSGSCAQLKAFAFPQNTVVFPQNLNTLQVSPDGQSILVILGGKLGISRDGGASAVWRDLPTDSGEALSIDAIPIDKSRNLAAPLFLGTTAGLFHSADGGLHWIPSRGGLPAAPVSRFFSVEQYLFVALQEAGWYGSHDLGATWQRLDQDAQRGSFAGMVETSPGVILLASQSEGLLRWTANAP